MDRDTILKHSKAIRLEHKLLPDFTEILSNYCEIKAHPEHLQVLIQMIQMPMIGNEILNAVLEYFEKEYHIIRLEKLPDNYSANIKQLINIF